MNYKPTPEQAAILLWVADKVKSAPHLYDFKQTETARKPDCGAPHCLLGWAAVKTGSYCLTGAAQALGFNRAGVFYQAMNDTQGNRCLTHGLWTSNADEAARALRILAGQAKTKTPDWSALASGTNALASKAKPMEVL